MGTDGINKDKWGSSGINAENVRKSGYCREECDESRKMLEKTEKVGKAGKRGISRERTGTDGNRRAYTAVQ